MAHHEVVENNVKKELSYALIGILACLGLVLLILISAIVRPAGNHVDVAKLNAEVEAKAAASAAAAAKPAGSTPAATSPAAGGTTTATAASGQRQHSAPRPLSGGAAILAGLGADRGAFHQGRRRVGEWQ